MGDLSQEMKQTVLNIYDNGHKSEDEVTELLNKTYGTSISVKKVQKELVSQNRIKIVKISGTTVTHYLNGPDQE